MSEGKNPPSEGTRRGPGEGSVDELPSGKFRARVRLPDGRRVSKVFGDRPSAESFRRGAAAIFAEQSAGDVADTFGEFGKRWLDARELAGEHRSIDTQRSVWRHHVEGTPLAARPVREVERRDVREWLAAMRLKKATVTRRKGSDGHELVATDRPLARGTIHSALVLVRQALQAALDDELLETNPARDVKLGRGRATTEKKWTYLEAAEIEAVLHAADDVIPYADRLLYAVAIYTGLREGELWGLRWPEVTLDGERPQIEVRYSFDGPPKNGRVRVVPLLGPAREALATWKKLCPKTRLGLVFPSDAGEIRHEHSDNGWSDRPVGQGKARKVHAGHKTKAGVARRVRFHDLRHTCASHLVMGTWGRAWRLEEVRDFLGHTAITTTLRYAHLSPDHLHKAAKETGSGGSGGGAGKGNLRVLGHGRVTEGVTAETRKGNDGVSNPPVRGSSPFEGAQRIQGVRLETLTGRDPGVTQSARALLVAVAAGEGIPAAMVDALVTGVLDHPLVALALRAREPGPMRLTLALRLAAEILAASEALHEIERGHG